jgi:hypothetical protein
MGQWTSIIRLASPMASIRLSCNKVPTVSSSVSVFYGKECWFEGMLLAHVCCVFVCAVAGAAAALQLTASSAAAAAGGDDTAAAAAEGPAELWMDKYSPRSISELVVHKKKVQEVQDWLTFYQEHKSRHHTRAVMVTGRTDTCTPLCAVGAAVLCSTGSVLKCSVCVWSWLLW